MFNQELVNTALEITKEYMEDFKKTSFENLSKRVAHSYSINDLLKITYEASEEEMTLILLVDWKPFLENPFNRNDPESPKNKIMQFKSHLVRELEKRLKMDIFQIFYEVTDCSKKARASNDGFKGISIEINFNLWVWTLLEE